MKKGLYWNDPEPIKGNDYRVNKLIGATDEMCEITYNKGKSTAEAYYHELELRTGEAESFKITDWSKGKDYNEAMRRLMIYIGKYEISFQFWGHNYNQVSIMRHDMEIYESAQHETPLDAINDALKWLDRADTKPKKL